MKPTTEDGAFENGFNCRMEGHNIEYNPYRNMGMETGRLYSAWIDGWSKADNQINQRTSLK